MSRDWDAHFLARARLNASMSTCLRRQVGAIAVRDRRALADGFNGNLPGATHCVDGGCARCGNAQLASGVGLERCVCVHAEMNLVAYCAATGTPLRGATVYGTTQPCMDCLKLLVSAGVIEVVYAEPYADQDALPDAHAHLVLRRHEVGASA